MAGLATVFGSGAMSNSITEIENNDALFVIGSNTTESHPIIGLRMKRAVKKGAKLIVADPRKIPLVKFATLWLRHRPGTDVALLNSIMHVILAEELEDKKFIEARTEGFDEFRKEIAGYTPEEGERITGVPAADIVKSARMYAEAESAGIYYTMGITQHSTGTNNVWSVANLALLTGNLGREHCGVNPLRGQNNVQGSSDMACAPAVLPGYQKVTDEAVRKKFEKVWLRSVPSEPGLTATEMTDAMIDGNVKALYIMGENPVISDPHMAHSLKALKSLDFLVVQDIFLTETARLADVVLPAASFAEKDGTFTNTERRVQRVRKAIAPPGDALDDLSIICRLAGRMGYGMCTTTPEEIFLEAAALWPGLAGMTYQRLKDGGLQWPCPSPDHPGTRYLFRGKFPRGKAAFSPVPYTPSKELPDEEYPLVLTTGRILFQYHTGTMTRRSTPLEAWAREPFIEVNPEDAARLGVADSDMLTVSSRRGSLNVKAKVTERVASGVVFMPFHYHEAAANVLTNDALDPVCKIPEAKVCAVRVEKTAAGV